MKMNKFKARLIIIGAIVLLAIALPITIYLVQQQQTLRQGAEEGKTISLTPQNVPAEPGGTAEFTLEINPQGASVKNIKFVIKYDPAKLEALDFGRDLGLAFETKATSFTTGQVMMEYGTDILANYFSTQKTIGKLTFKVLGTPGTIATVTIDSSEIAGGDGNPISGFIPSNAQVSIGAAACIADQSTCAWDAVSGATGYHYEIKSGEELITQGDTAETSVKFTSVAGKTYTCSVNAVNNCGSGARGSDTATCAGPTSTPTSTPTRAPTATPTKTPTNTPTATSTLTPTATPTNGPTATPTNTPTATPTTVVRIPTNTPTPTSVIVVTQVAQSSPQPTLAPTGSNNFTVGAILGAGLIIIGGLLLLVL